MQKSRKPVVFVGTRDLVTIGIFAAITLAIFFVIGGIAGMTVIGTVANIPIVCLFTATPHLLLAAKVKRTGTIFIMGAVNVLPGLMVGNLVGIALSLVGWAVAELIATWGRYGSRRILVSAYVVGCTIQSAGYTFPLYYSSVQYLTQRQEMLRLTDELLERYLALFSWPVWGAMVALTALTALVGSVIALHLMRRHFVKAGIIVA